MNKIVIASKNRGKVKEIQALLADLPVEVVIPDTDLDVEETGITFEENALLKAKAYKDLFPNDLILADDSGLEVDALNGRPGVYSKRYANSDLERNKKLLEELEDISDDERTARFISVIALVGPNIEQTFRGTLEGTIADSIRGDYGFGYDPVFMPLGYQKTFAELGLEIKNTLSHRARALAEVKKFLQRMLG